MVRRASHFGAAVRGPLPGHRAGLHHGAIAAKPAAMAAVMTYALAVLIALFAGWSVAACEALFRAEDKPGPLRGNAGMLLLLAATAAGGLLLAGAAIWVLKVSPSASVAAIIGLFGLLGAK